MTAIAELVEPLKRASAPPGQFPDLFPEATDDLLTEQLADAFAEAQLDGFLTTVELAFGFTTPDITPAEGALVVLYAARRMLETWLRNLRTHVRYEAGSATFEEDRAVSLPVELLRSHNERLAGILERARLGDHSGGFEMVDLYLTRATVDYDPAGWEPVAPHVLDALGI